MRADAARRTLDLASFVIHGAGPPDTGPVSGHESGPRVETEQRAVVEYRRTLQLAPRHVSLVDVINLDGYSGWIARTSCPRSCRTDCATVLTIHLCGL